jgi:hypothetical protein
MSFESDLEDYFEYERHEKEAEAHREFEREINIQLDRDEEETRLHSQESEGYSGLGDPEVLFTLSVLALILYNVYCV